MAFALCVFPAPVISRLGRGHVTLQVWWNWSSVALIAPHRDTEVIMKSPPSATLTKHKSTKWMHWSYIEAKWPIWPFQRSTGADAWKRRAFSRRFAACKCDQQSFRVSGSYQISYSWREIGRRVCERCHVHLFQSDSCEKMILTATACVRSPRSGDWHFYDSAHPRQRQRRPCDSSAHHAHHHMQVNVCAPRLCLCRLPPSQPTCYLQSLLQRQITSSSCCE